MFRARLLLALFLVICWSSSPVSAADCTASNLKPFSGTWKADGWWQAIADGEKSRVLCRISFNPSPDGLRLDASGKCASDGNAEAVTGWLACKNGSLRGPLLTLKGDRTQKLTTIRSVPTGLTIDVTTVATTGGEAGHYLLDVSMMADEITLAFTVIEMTADGFHSALLNLKRIR